MSFNNFRNIATTEIYEDALTTSGTALMIQTDDASRTRLVTGAGVSSSA
jgi:hypothetical protein